MDWFRSSSDHRSSTTTTMMNASNTTMNIKDAIRVINPSNTATIDRLQEQDRSRFSQLLLEHGEKHLQDWAVVCYSQPIEDGRRNNSLHKVESLPSDLYSSNDNNINGNRMTRNSAAVQYQRSRTGSSNQVDPNLDHSSYPSLNMTKIEGRLHLCSRSLVFEPLDQSRGILRCPFSRMDAPPKEFPTTSDSTTTTGSFAPMCIEFRCQRHVVMKTNNAIAPFDTITAPVHIRCTFLHSTPESFVELCQKLFDIMNHKSSGGGAATMATSFLSTPELDEMLQPMLDRPFDPNNIVDVLREQPLTSNLRCWQLTPLQSKPGCCILTMERLYFQPAMGVIADGAETKAVHWLLRDAAATARRYHGLADSAVEVFWKDGSSVLLAFERRHEREQVMRLLPKHIPCHTDRQFVVEAAKDWQKGNLSNYEYLLALNSAAGRSFHDLSRYPVFPWVIADYTSFKLDLSNPKTFRDLTKPVGALDEERLDYFRTRLEGMQDMGEAFLYGTHYSAPGYVLYYLLRSMPEHMLCLQNGKFDAPDRMFHSISHCFNCALSNHADVKELIPEFYNPNGNFDFLINARSLQLGATQNGDRVNDVELPPWAKSPRDFLKKNRKALESEICIRMLPNWIDLIFGFKSRGEAAMEACNLFHPCAYLGPADLGAMESKDERFQAELQATEFGIVPDMLFSGPHPAKGAQHDHQQSELTEFVSPNIGRASSGDDMAGNKDAWELLDVPSQHTGDDAKSMEHGESDELFDDDASREFHQHNESTSSNGGVGFGSAAVLFQQPTNAKGSTNHDATTSNTAQPKLQMDKKPQHDPNDDPEVAAAHMLDVNFDRQLAKESNNYSIEIPGIEAQGSADNFVFPLSGSGESIRKGNGFSFLDSKAPPSAGSTGTLSIDRASNHTSGSGEWEMSIIERKRIHGDAITGCQLLFSDSLHNKQSYLATVSLDGGMIINLVTLTPSNGEDSSLRTFTGTLSRLSYMAINRGQVTPSSQSKLTEFRRHSSRDPLACLALASDGQGGKVAFSGGHDDVVLAYGINTACAVASVYSHRDAVTGIALICRPKTYTESSLWLENSTHIMVSGSWDATVKVWSVSVATGETVSINREPLAELFDAESSIVCLTAILVTNGGLLVAAGCADGGFVAWNCHNNGVNVVIHKEPSKRGAGPCSAVKWTLEGEHIHLFAGFSTGKVASFSVADGMLRKASAVSLGIAVQCLDYAEGILLVGCSDGGLRLLPIRDGAYFDSKPTLWPAVNDKSAPGISCVSITTVSDSSNRNLHGRCFCTTGADDGTVAVFELKRTTSGLRPLF